MFIKVKETFEFTFRSVFGVIIGCLGFLVVNGQAYQSNAKLDKQLEDSRYLKTIMKPYLEDAGLTRWVEKEVFESRSLPLASDVNALRVTGPGTMHIDNNVTISGNGSVRIDMPTSLEKKNPSNRAYASAGIVRPLDNEDIRDYNRFSVWIYVDAPGLYTAFAGFSLHNNGEKIMPLPGRFEGQHYENVYVAICRDIRSHTTRCHLPRYTL